MAFYPEKIAMDGRTLRLMEKPAKHRYCCKGCKERDVRPCYKHEDEHLHRECYDSCKAYSIMFNLSNSKSKCDFAFHKEALGGKGVCDACGDDVKGWFFKCKICKEPHYLHPCCAKLPIKKCVDTTAGGEIVMDLKAESLSKCLICGNKENSDGFSGWYYISRCGNYCYHWSCMKHMALKKWKKDDDQSNRKRRRKTGASSQAMKTTTKETITIQKQDYDTGKKSAALPTTAKDPIKKTRLDSGNQKQGSETTKKKQAMQPSQDRKKRPRLKGIITLTAKVAVELLNIFIPLFFGLPPLPFGLVLESLKLLK